MLVKRIIATILVVFMSSGLYAQDKSSIAVWDFEAMGLSDQEVDILSRRVVSLLVATDHYVVTDRNNMQAILEEQSFQLSGCTSNECIVEIGQLLGVQKMLSGSIGKFGSMFTIEMYIIDIATGQIERSANYDVSGEMEKLLTEGIGSALHVLLGKIDIEIPEKAISGEIPAMENNTVPNEAAPLAENDVSRNISSSGQGTPGKKLTYQAALELIIYTGYGPKFGVEYDVFNNDKLLVNVNLGYNPVAVDGTPLIADILLKTKISPKITLGSGYKYSEYYEEGFDDVGIQYSYWTITSLTAFAEYDISRFFISAGAVMNYNEDANAHGGGEVDGYNAVGFHAGIGIKF